jgi:hypothetical protein
MIAAVALTGCKPSTVALSGGSNGTVTSSPDDGPTGTGTTSSAPADGSTPTAGTPPTTDPPPTTPAPGAPPTTGKPATTRPGGAATITPAKPATTTPGKPTATKPTATKPATTKPATTKPAPAPQPAPGAGNPGGHVSVPAAGRAVDTSRPTTVVGRGTAAGCTSAAVVAAVAKGGIVTFDCGAAPVTITLAETVKIHNFADRDTVIDGGGKVTLSGGGVRRIIFQKACDLSLGQYTSHCDDQDYPRTVLQNITLANGNSGSDTDGGGAVFAQGGSFRVVNARFVDNRCIAAHSDAGGAALRVFQQYQGRPVYVVGSTFSGGSCANGGGISSIGVSWVVLNSLFTNNTATGTGASSGQGGNGGAIYLDGNQMTLTVGGTLVERNTANAGGGGIFFVSNNRTGTMSLDASTLRGNVSKSFETSGLPGVFFLGARSPAVTGGTTLTK